MSAGEFRFDLQKFLSEMREEQRRDLAELRDEQREAARELSTRIDNALRTLQDHETRLVVVESTRKSVRWLAGTVIAALVGAALDVLFVHIPKLFKP
jgi:ABC-type transporter Mla subunit MlaD